MVRPHLPFAGGRWQSKAAELLRARVSERGATAVEYALMVALVAIAVLVAVTAFGVAVSGLFVIPVGVFNGP